jgi:hypothetical protein
VVSGRVCDSTVTWSYTSGTARSANNSTTNRVSFVQGLQEDYFTAAHVSRNSTAGSGFGVWAIGLDAVTVFSGQIGESIGTTAANGVAQLESQLLGFHFMQAMEAGDGSNATTFTGRLTAGQAQALHYSGRF